MSPFGIDERVTSFVHRNVEITRNQNLQPIELHGFHRSAGNPNMVPRAKTPVTSKPMASFRSSSSKASIWNGS